MRNDRAGVVNMCGAHEAQCAIASVVNNSRTMNKTSHYSSDTNGPSLDGVQWMGCMALDRFDMVALSLAPALLGWEIFPHLRANAGKRASDW